MDAIEQFIDDFVCKIVEICDEPLDGDKTEYITKEVQKKLDTVFANKPDRKYSQISWAVQDVLEEADSLDIAITEEQAENILSEYSERITEAMLEVGWFVIREALLQEHYEKKEAKDAT
jgi:3-methyladenine DNA glycosylase AlkC